MVISATFLLQLADTAGNVCHPALQDQVVRTDAPGLVAQVTALQGGIQLVDSVVQHIAEPMHIVQLRRLTRKRQALTATGWETKTLKDI